MPMLRGFVLEGAGTAEVRTPPVYRPGAPARVTVDGAATQATADGDGRLTLPVALGDDGRADVRIVAPARTCVRTVRVPRVLRGVRVTANGRRRVRKRRVLVTVPGRARSRS